MNGLRNITGWPEVVGCKFKVTTVRIVACFFNPSPCPGSGTEER